LARNPHYGKVIEAIRIDNAGAEGKSIARWDGKVVFVPYAAPGDLVDLKIVGKKKKFLFGEIERIIEKGEDRVEPTCQHFGLCGGCKWQHLNYNAQLRYKEQQVRDAFDRIGKLEYPALEPIIAAPQQFGYRNKMEYTFSNNRWMTREEVEGGGELDKNAVGFHIPGRYDKVLQIEKCHLQAEPTNDIRNWILAHAQSKSYSFYDIRTHEGLLRNLILRNTTAGEWMVLLSFGEDDQEAIQDILQNLSEHFPNLACILYVINTKVNDTIYDLDIHAYKGNAWITQTLGDKEFRIRAKSFFQTNPEQAKTLYDVAKDFADIKETDSVFDLYCGTGTIGLYMADKAKKMVGVESVPQAIVDANENAKRNGISNAVFEVGDMMKIFTSDFLGRHGIPDIIITDPPRSGMHPKVVEQLNQSGVERIVYVSCNAATQARDLDLMREHYRIEKVQPVDMFPQTHHVENVVLLKRI
jgi:23S rRNA (uracil1939-C5)-methyltransferase